MENIKCSHPKMIGQNDRQDESLTGQALDQAGHCPLTGRYFEPWCFLCLTVAALQFQQHHSGSCFLGLVTHWVLKEGVGGLRQCGHPHIVNRQRDAACFYTYIQLLHGRT